jgi:hypothetical protein
MSDAPRKTSAILLACFPLIPADELFAELLKEGIVTDDLVFRFKDGSDAGREWRLPAIARRIE